MTKRQFDGLKSGQKVWFLNYENDVVGVRMKVRDRVEDLFYLDWDDAVSYRDLFLTREDAEKERGKVMRREIIRRKKDIKELERILEGQA